jgi:hypothetical protein
MEIRLYASKDYKSLSISSNNMDRYKLQEGTIKCPHCGELVPINSTLHKQLAETLQAELKKGFEVKLLEERKKWEQGAGEKAEAKVAVELQALREAVQEKDKKLEEARGAELALRRRERELAEREKERELEIARKLDAERKEIEETTVRRIMEEHRFKDAEKEKQINDMRKQIEDLKRKAEQGSQQTQGEVAELELEENLRAVFPFDEIVLIAKGARGADVLQKVKDGYGRECGTILWESKHTKAWTTGWIQKLKEDQREAKAELAVIASKALPGDIKNFGDVEGVYVTNHESIFGVATVLRAQLIRMYAAKQSMIGKNEKLEVIWNYLHGTQFKQRVEAIIEAFSAMKENLEKEKKALSRLWAEREKQIEQVIHNTGGMYGDLQGLLGGSMPAIQALELPLLEEVAEEA